LAKKLKADIKTSASNRAKPSFPAKKRVQVPQDILSETPMRNLKTGGTVSLINKEGTQNEKGDQVKEPFFWLREEKDGEMLSQHSDENLIIEGSTPVPPSFSDLKDADDESPSKQAVSSWLITNKYGIRNFEKSHFHLSLLS
jgi:BRCA1-associated RING domain protein 1